jgi:hypothetical protein
MPKARAVISLTADYNATYAYQSLGTLREKDYTNQSTEYYLYTPSEERIGVKHGTSSNSTTILVCSLLQRQCAPPRRGLRRQPQMA